jgi:hypothetical protein
MPLENVAGRKLEEDDCWRVCRLIAQKHDAEVAALFLGDVPSELKALRCNRRQHIAIRLAV